MQSDSHGNSQICAGPYFCKRSSSTLADVSWSFKSDFLFSFRRKRNRRQKTVFNLIGHQQPPPSCFLYKIEKTYFFFTFPLTVYFSYSFFSLSFPGKEVPTPSSFSASSPISAFVLFCFDLFFFFGGGLFFAPFSLSSNDFLLLSLLLLLRFLFFFFYFRHLFFFIIHFYFTPSFFSS